MRDSEMGWDPTGIKEGSGNAPNPLEVLASLGENLQPLIEFCAGYRQKLLVAGWSPLIAEQMAAVLHGEMVKLIIGRNR